jgi:hypothetical protein
MRLKEFQGSQLEDLVRRFNNWITKARNEDGEVKIVDKLFSSTRWEQTNNYVLLIFYEGDGGKDV